MGEFDPSHFIMTPQLWRHRDQFDKEEVQAAIRENVPHLTTEEVVAMQPLVQESFFVLGAMHEALVEHRIANAAPPQMGVEAEE